MQSKPLTIAIVAAATAVGRELVPVLEERSFPVKELRLLGADEAVGEKIETENDEWTVQAFSKEAFAGVDLVFVPPAVDFPAEFVEAAKKAGAVIVDAAGVARDSSAPLVFPGINDEELEELEDVKGRVIGLASSTAAQLAAVLIPLEAKAGLTRVDAVILEAVSTFDVAGMEELSMETVSLLSGKEPERALFPHRIAFNVIPHIGPFEKDGTTRHERRVAAEVARLLGRELKAMSITCAVAPVFYGSMQMLTVATDRPLQAAGARESLAGAEGLKLLDSPEDAVYPMPMLAVGDESLHVGRVRDTGAGLALVSVADGLRWGTVIPMVQVAELLREQGLI